MKIKLDNIPESGLNLELSYEKDWLKYLQKGHREEDFEFISPITAYLELSRSRTDVFIRGELAGKLQPQCSRCLKTFDYDLVADFHCSLAPLPQSFDKEEAELSREDMELSFYQGGEIDLDEVISEQLVLSVPPAPLCQKECKGLCPLCGTDFNEKGCNCQKETISGLAVLKNFKLEKC
ncbi:MAG: DUF177 domain-containing protein [Deltaproteobacteria bacterium]|nr:MAG: DUF177 domain-containing protein [Deltaproteobacteria bacterium]